MTAPARPLLESNIKRVLNIPIEHINDYKDNLYSRVMIKFFDSFEKFKKSILPLDIKAELDKVLDLDFPFFDKQKKYTLIAIPIYNSTHPQHILLLSKKKVFAYSDFNFNEYNKSYKEVITKPYGESTIITLGLLKNILRNYSLEFEKVRNRMTELDLNPILESIETSGRELRHLTDRLSELVRLIMTLKERDIEEFNTTLISFDYEILTGEARYWLERCRSHIYRVASLRTKSEMRTNRELNSTMRRLTVIITFLTITSIVVSVPGTIGAIFGIPALSDAYFKPHTTLLVLILIIATLLSIVLGYLYWKSLGLRN